MPTKLTEEQRLQELKEWYIMLHFEYHRLSDFMKVLALRRLCELKDYDACMMYGEIITELNKLAEEKNDKRAKQILEDLKKIGPKYEVE